MHNVLHACVLFPIQILRYMFCFQGVGEGMKNGALNDDSELMAIDHV